MREKQAQELRQKVQECRAEQEMLSAEITKLYEEYVGCKLTKQTYSEQKSVLSEKVEQAYSAEEELLAQCAVWDSGHSEFVEKYKYIHGLVTLTKEQIGDLLERVTVFPKGRLEIRLRFVGRNNAAS